MNSSGGARGGSGIGSTPRSRRRLRDTRSDVRARWIKAFAWAVFPALPIGVTLAVVVDVKVGLTAMLLVFLGVGGVAIAASELVGEIVRGVTNRDGRARPGGHSRADALVARGEPRTALTVLRVSLDEYPDDPEALIRIPRILRDELNEPMRALEAFRVARASGALSPAQCRVTMREMLELARKLGEPALVAADLEAHRERFADGAEAAWAARELEPISRPGDASAS